MMWVCSTRYISERGPIIRHVYGMFPTEQAAKTWRRKALAEANERDDQERLEVSVHCILHPETGVAVSA